MENNNQNNKEEYLLPKEVLTHVNNLIGKGAHTLSTVIETEFYTQEALNRMLEKNKFGTESWRTLELEFELSLAKIYICTIHITFTP